MNAMKFYILLFSLSFLLIGTQAHATSINGNIILGTAYSGPFNMIVDGVSLSEGGGIY